MKKILYLLFVLALPIGARAGEPTTDYVNATGLQYDNVLELYYFDIVLEGSSIYTGYGMDIQLPAGMKVMENEGTIYVLMNEDMYPKNKLTKQFSHMVTPVFPYEDDHSHLRVGCMSSLNEDMLYDSGTLFRVYVTTDYTTNTWPIGVISVYDVELDKVGSPFDAQVKETIISLHSGSTTLPLNISSANKWSTCILPFSTEIPEGVNAYTCTGCDDEYVYLSVAESLDAYKPYILYCDIGYSGIVSGIVDAVTCPQNGATTDGYLRGAVVAQTATEGCIMQNQGDGVKFYAITDGASFAIPAGKCWLAVSDSAKAKGFKINSIDDIENVSVYDSNKVFDILGRQHNGAEKGLIINNGKKFIKK